MIPFVSVDDFTGTDQSRINQAIAAITPTGGTIIFPKRTYTIDNFTLLSHMSVLGNGSTITRTADVNAPFIDLAQYATNVNISGLIFNGNKATQTQNNAGAIRCTLNQDVNITNCVFNEVLRVAVVIDSCIRVNVSNVSFNRLGRVGAGQGVSVSITSSKDIVVENASTVDNYGEGTSVVSSQGVIFRNHTYTIGNPTFSGGDNAITFTQCADFVVENIEASHMQNAGIEINACDRFKLSNLNLHDNASYNLMISVFTPGGAEISSTNGEVSNVISQNAGGFAGVNIIGSHHISFNNITDNKRVRFALSATGIPSMNVEIKNSTFNELEISGSKDVRILNTTFVTPLISGSTYSLINFQNKFETYFQADLNNNASITVKIPETAAGGTTFFCGTLNVDNTFAASASLQFTSRIVHIKLIWDKLYQNVISTLQGSVTSREFVITGGSNTLTIKNISGVATTLRGRLVGTVDMY
ncbi:MAG TPA: hypothetical protein VL443_07645 [Cyclobacteriaceae bacterium]|nr:hypothetical protein [Cyclobacteriaceae bacterium]